MKNTKARELVREIAGGLYLFTSLMSILFIARHFLVDHDLGVIARLIEVIKHDPLAIIKGGDFANPEDFVNNLFLWLWW